MITSGRRADAVYRLPRLRGDRRSVYLSLKSIVSKRVRVGFEVKLDAIRWENYRRAVTAARSTSVNVEQNRKFRRKKNSIRRSRFWDPPLSPVFGELFVGDSSRTDETKNNENPTIFEK